MYRDAVVKYANETMSSLYDWEMQFTMENALQSAFVRLDKDFRDEAFFSSQLNINLLSIALTGVLCTMRGQLKHASLSFLLFSKADVL